MGNKFYKLKKEAKMKKVLIIVCAICMLSTGVVFGGGGQNQNQIDCNSDLIDPPDLGGDPALICNENSAKDKQPQCGSNDVGDPGCAAPGD